MNESDMDEFYGTEGDDVIVSKEVSVHKKESDDSNERNNVREFEENFNTVSLKSGQAVTAIEPRDQLAILRAMVEMWAKESERDESILSR